LTDQGVIDQPARKAFKARQAKVRADCRMTRDADLSSHGVASDKESLRSFVAQICALTPDPHDGMVIDPANDQD
jgi:hypothetical protein